jgi:hypothetical protein
VGHCILISAWCLCTDYFVVAILQWQAGAEFSSGKVQQHPASFHGAIQDHIRLLRLSAALQTALQSVYIVKLDHLVLLMVPWTWVRVHCVSQENTLLMRAPPVVMIVLQVHSHISLGQAVLHRVYPALKENMLMPKQWVNVRFALADFFLLCLGALDVPHVTLVSTSLTMAPMTQLHALLAILVSIHKQVQPIVTVVVLAHIHLHHPKIARIVRLENMHGGATTHHHACHARVDYIQGLQQWNAVCANQENTLTWQWPPQKRHAFLAVSECSQAMDIRVAIALNISEVQDRLIFLMKTAVCSFRFHLLSHFTARISTKHWCIQTV